MVHLFKKLLILLFLISLFSSKPIHAQSYRCVYNETIKICATTLCPSGYTYPTNCLLIKDPDTCNSTINLSCEPIPGWTPGFTPTKGTFRCLWLTDTCLVNPDDIHNSTCEMDGFLGANCVAIKDINTCNTTSYLCGTTEPAPSPAPTKKPGSIEGNPPNNAAELLLSKCPGEDSLNTAIGCINIQDINKFTHDALIWGLGISGGIAMLLIIYSNFLTSTSEGNPQKFKAAQEMLLSAIAGIIMLIFSVFILKFIGVNLFGFF